MCLFDWVNYRSSSIIKQINFKVKFAFLEDDNDNKNNVKYIHIFQ